MSKYTDGNQPLTIRRRHLNGYQWYVFVMLTIGALFMLFPFVWMILSAFKTKADVYAYPPRWIPSEWKWENFAKVFEMIPFWRYYFNSIVTSVIETALQIVISVMAAYSITKLRYPGKGLFLAFMRSSLFVPMVVTMIPMYLLVASLGWLDSYAGTMANSIPWLFRKPVTSSLKDKICIRKF